MFDIVPVGTIIIMCCRLAQVPHGWKDISATPQCIEHVLRTHEAFPGATPLPINPVCLLKVDEALQS